MKFTKHPHCKPMQMHIYIGWKPRTLPKPRQWMFFSEQQMLFSLENIFKSRPPIKSCQGEQATLHLLLTLATLKPIWTPSVQNQDLNSVTLLNCRCENAGTIHAATFWALLNSQQLWSWETRRKCGRPRPEEPSAAQMTPPQADLRGRRGRPQEMQPG